jgi:uncharacterized protein (TIRG00374 family)
MAERLTDVAALLVLAALGVTALPRGPLLLSGMAVAVVAAVVVLRAPAVGRPARHLLPGRLVEPARLFLESGRALVTSRALAVGLALSLAAWFLECVAFALIMDGLGVLLALRSATFVYAFASLAGAASMLPGGLGVAEGSLTALVAGLGSPLPEAAAGALLVRAATLWLAVALGVVTVALAFRRGAAPQPAEV